MFTIIGHVVVVVFALFGGLILVGLMCDYFIPDKPAPAVEPAPPKPQPQVTNLRVVPPPVPEGAKDELPILQRTTMQITTTKYVDPTRKEIEASQ